MKEKEEGLNHQAIEEKEDVIESINLRAILDKVQKTNQIEEENTKENIKVKENIEKIRKRIKDLLVHIQKTVQKVQ